MFITTSLLLALASTFSAVVEIDDNGARASRTAARLALMVGGTDVLADLSNFREHGGNIVVGTPGRIDDVMTRIRELSCKELELLVLDEADRLLDMGSAA